jgi:chorismate mutase
MVTKGIRGAITVEANTEDALKEATLELLSEMFEQNNIQGTTDISHVIFTTTKDLNIAFPAKFPRVELGWSDVAMMCYHELDVPNSLPMCLRILIVYNCDKDFIPKFVYLKGTEKLRN